MNQFLSHKKKRFEYKVVHFNVAFYGEYSEWLNEMGENGWEFCALNIDYHIFKRQIIDI